MCHHDSSLQCNDSKHVHLQGIPIAFFWVNFQSVHAHDTRQLDMCMYTYAYFGARKAPRIFHESIFTVKEFFFSLESKDGEGAQTF